MSEVHGFVDLNVGRVKVAVRAVMARRAARIEHEREGLIVSAMERRRHRWFRPYYMTREQAIAHLKKPYDFWGSAWTDPEIPGSLSAEHLSEVGLAAEALLDDDTILVSTYIAALLHRDLVQP